MASDLLPREAADPTPQHIAALRRANRIRAYRAEVKRAIAEGRLAVSDVFDDEDMAAMPLLEALLAQHRWGLHRAQRLMRDVGIGETVKVGRLTERQRGELRARGV